MTTKIPLKALFAATLAMAAPMTRAEGLAATPRSSSTTAETDRLLWNDVPVAFTVPVGTESVLRLPRACEEGIPPELAGKLRVEGVKNVLLLKATEAFPSARLALRSIVGNHVYLLDIAATKTARTQQFELIDPSIAAPAGAPLADRLEPVPPPGDLRIALTRFASHEFYAPERLRGGLSATRVNVPATPVDLYRGGAVRAIPRASWAYHGHFVTAIELGNLTPDARELDPRLLRGTWLTATFQHSVIAPQGTDGALTMVYLVSDRPFGDTL